MSPSQTSAIVISGIIIAFITVGTAWANPQIDVKDFGAKGDGKTDETISFQKALDNASKKGGIVHIAPGIYRLDGTLVVPHGVTLQGVWEGPHDAELDNGQLFSLMPGGTTSLQFHSSGLRRIAQSKV